jgi:hypothetical protein
MSIKKFVSMALLVAVTSVSVGVGGCYGSFALTGKLHNWVGNLGNKFVSTLVFWVTASILPVYYITLVADFLIFNLIEFWTGSNPMAMGEIYEEMDGNGNKIYAVRNADGTLSVTMTSADGKKADFTLVRDDLEVRALNTEGVVIAQQALPYHNNYSY